MKKKLLLIIATHGNERIGIEAVKILEDKGLEKYFDILIGNPLASEKNIRFIDADLNRSYPGNPKSKLYEQKIAAENLKVAENYKYVIDIHEANEGTDDFMIAPRERLPQNFPLSLIDLKKVLLWPDPKGATSEILENSIELEFGTKDKERTRVAAKVAKIINGFIRQIYSNKTSTDKQNKEIFYVYGKLLKSELPKEPVVLCDFKQTELNGENFLPLLTNQYLSDGIICYKMRKL